MCYAVSSQAGLLQTEREIQGVAVNRRVLCCCAACDIFFNGVCVRWKAFGIRGFFSDYLMRMLLSTQHFAPRAKAAVVRLIAMDLNYAKWDNVVSKHAK